MSPRPRPEWSRATRLMGPRGGVVSVVARVAVSPLSWAACPTPGRQSGPAAALCTARHFAGGAASWPRAAVRRSARPLLSCLRWRAERLGRGSASACSRRPRAGRRRHASPLRTCGPAWHRAGTPPTSGVPVMGASHPEYHSRCASDAPRIVCAVRQAAMRRAPAAPPHAGYSLWAGRRGAARTGGAASCRQRSHGHAAA